ncbi:hypothetical protein FACS189494_09340 [Spirochaetia bacterium]|nr:hypothetical protein FACS189494_09340 [Spirochaetia bacterium]
MNSLQTKKASAPANYKAAALTIADMNADAILDNASPAELEAIIKAVMSRRLVDRMDTAAKLAGIDYSTEKDTFLNNAGKTASEHTQRTYKNALSKLETYTAANTLNILELKPLQADNFIYALKASGASAATVRITAAAVSSFFTFLERRHSGTITNPIRGTKARPADKKAKSLDIPTAAEVKTIIKAIPPNLAAAVSVMAYRGLRCGALPSLKITQGERFKAHSKGKDIRGNIGAAALDAMSAAGLELSAPFANTNANALERIIGYYIGKLYKAGKIHAAYSCHDFRHFYAVTTWTKNKDIKELQNLLSHASIAITDRYLRSLDAE